MRILNKYEIQEIWTALTEGPGDDAKRRAIKLLLVTGQRPEAVAAMHHGEISGELWTIPQERNTCRRPHHIHLSSLALGQLGEQSSGYAFPTADGRNSITVNSLSRFIRGDEAEKQPYFGLNRWTLMDLRRTVQFYMKKLMVAPDVLACVFSSFAEAEFNSKFRSTVPLGHPTEEPLLRWEAELRRIVDSPRIDSQPLKFGL